MKAAESSRIWLVGGAVVALVIVLVAWFGLIGPKLSTVPTQHDAADSAAAANDALEAKVATLRAESRNMDALVAQLAVARDELPIQADLPAFIEQLGGQAKLAGVALTNLSIGAVSVTGTGATAATAVTGSTDSGSDSSSSSGSDATTSTPAATTATAGATAATAGPAGQLFEIQITTTTSGTFRHQQGFLTELQNPGSRAALITSAQLAPVAAATAASSPSANTDSSEAAPTTAASIDGVSALTTVFDIFVAPQTPAAAAELSKQLASRTTR